MIALSACDASIGRTQAPMAERQSRSRLQRKESAMSRGPDLSDVSLLSASLLCTSLSSASLSSASKHFRQATACGLFAANAQSAADRELLLRMQRSLLEQAYHEDWLDGLPPVPSGRPNALAVPRRS